MRIFYADEQEGSKGGRKYTAVVIAHIDAQSVHQMRFDYFVKAREILFSALPAGNIKNVPPLHGSDLLRGVAFDDSQRLSCVDALMGTFVNHGGRFRRVGYFDDSVPFLPDKKARVVFCLHNAFMRDPDWSLGDQPWMVTSEMDKESLKAGMKTLDTAQSMNYQLATMHGWEGLTFDFRNLIGHFFALKHDLGCQAADLSGYLALKADGSATDFGKSLSERFSAYSKYYDCNEIISMNFNQ